MTAVCFRQNGGHFPFSLLWMQLWETFLQSVGLYQQRRGSERNWHFEFCICFATTRPLKTDGKPVREHTTSDLATPGSEKKRKDFFLPKPLKFCAYSGFMAIMIVSTSVPSPRKCLLLNFSCPEYLIINKLFTEQFSKGRSHKMYF